MTVARSGITAETVAAAAPTTPPQRSWTRRMGVVLDSMRGRVFITRFQSRLTEPHDGWPAMRTELTALLTDVTNDRTSQHPRSGSPVGRKKFATRGTSDRLPRRYPLSSSCRLSQGRWRHRSAMAQQPLS
ncbi:hypothetical protein GCM10009609_47530 [Pseudonocardia aurantiaca]